MSSELQHGAQFRAGYLVVDAWSYCKAWLQSSSVWIAIILGTSGQVQNAGMLITHGGNVYQKAMYGGR